MLVVLCLATLPLYAQEEKRDWLLELGMGTTTYGSDARLSLMAGGDATYQIVPTLSLKLNYKKFGLELGYTFAETAAAGMKEHVDLYAVMPNGTALFPLTGKLDLELSGSIGMLIAHNRYEWGGKTYGTTRPGAVWRVGLGVLYRYDSDGSFLGLRCGLFDYGALDNTKFSLPTGLQATGETGVMSGVSLMLVSGVRF